MRQVPYTISPMRFSSFRSMHQDYPPLGLGQLRIVTIALRDVASVR